jgi:hypothetical protein
MHYARGIAALPVSEEERQSIINQLAASQPAFATRVGLSSANQAYSTPLPLSFAALRMVGAVDNPGVVYDPTAGTGALLITSSADTAIANELNTERSNLLSLAGFNAVTTHDATQWTPETPVDVVATNPPFGKQNSRATLPDGSVYGTTKLDHGIVIRALEALKDDGKAIIIVAGPHPKKLSDDVQRAAHYRQAENIKFNRELRKWFYLSGHFTVSGSMYRSQGAAWPVDVYTIVGRRQSPLDVQQADMPSSALPEIITQWEQLNGLVQTTRERGDELKRSGEQPATKHDGIPSGNGEHTLSTSTAGGGRGSGGKRSGSGTVQPGGNGNHTGNTGGVRGGGERGGQGNRTPHGDGGGVSTKTGAQSEGGRSGKPGGLGAKSGDTVSDTPRSRKKSDHSKEAPDGQRHYKSASDGDSLGTLVPEAHSSAIDRALSDLKKRVGKDIDKFVQGKLQYKSLNDLYDALAAEQIDALALAIDNLDNGSGFVIADQTGTGKGRFVASMIKYARSKGIVPVFMTEKPNLYVDMMRDMQDIGVTDLKPFITNQNITGKNALPFGDGKTLSRPKGNHNKNMDDAAANWDAAGFDSIFTTYDQMNTTNALMTSRHRLIQAIAPNAMFILDESHNAGGTGQTEQEVMRQAARGKNFLPREVLIRRFLRNSKGAVFSSATWAKRPEVMSLYAANTDLAIVDRGIGLRQLFERGGVPLQQAISTLLVESGQLMRREKSFEGIEFDTATTYEVDIEATDAVAEALSEIRSFDEFYVAPMKEGLGAALGQDSGQKISSTGFASVMHNLLDQAFTSLKTDQIAENAIESLKRGEKLVIGLSNTNETALRELMEIGGVTVGGKAEFTLKHLFERFLRNTLRYKVKNSADPNDKGHYEWILPEELPAGGFEAYQAVQEVINKIPSSESPGSPIDHIKGRIEQAGFRVGEITGREYGIDYESGTIYQRPKSETDSKGRKRTIDRFNGGSIDAPIDADQRLDAVIINQAGATGVSMHASEHFADRAPRTMLLAQYEKNIDVFMQMLGRVNRTGQVSLPRYIFPKSNIPAETRLHAVLRKKLISLNANVTGAGSGSVDIDVPDFMNEWGGEAAEEVLANNEEIARRMSVPDTANKEDFINKVTGRVGLLNAQDQETFYNDLFAAYRDITEQAKAMGANVGAMDVLPLDARPLRRRVVIPATGDRPMQRAVYAYEVNAKLLTRPATIEGIENELGQTLGTSGSLFALSNAGIYAVDKAWKKTEAKFDAYLEEITAGKRAEVKQKIAAAKRDAKRKGEQLSDSAEQEIRKKGEDALKSLLKRERDTERKTLALIDQLAPGKAISVTLNASSRVVSGIVGSLKKSGNAKNPRAASQWTVDIHLAMAEPNRISARLSNIGDGGLISVAESNRQEVIEDFEQAVEESKSGRVNRVVLVGNTPAAFSGFDGLITQFTDSTGGVADGVLLPSNIQSLDAAERRALSFKKPDALIDYLKRSGEVIKFDDGLARAAYRNGELIIQIAAKMGAGKFRKRPLVDALKSVGTDLVSTRSASGRKEWQARIGRIDSSRKNKEAAQAALSYMLGAARLPVIPDAKLDIAADALGIGNLPAAEDVSADEPIMGNIPQGEQGQSSIAATPTPNTPIATIRDTLKTAIGAFRLAKMEKSGLVRLVQSVDELEGRHSPDTQGFWDGETAWLVADNLHESDAVGVFLHELGEHAGMEAMLGDSYSALSDRIAKLAEGGDIAAQSALARIPAATAERHRASESIAYFIEEAHNRLQQSPASLSGKAKMLYRQIAGKIKAWFRQTLAGEMLAGRLGEFKLTDEYAVALAMRAVEFAGKGRTDKNAATNPDIRYSLRDLRQSATDAVYDFFHNDKNISLWEKSVGTMRGIAKKNKDFKAVYDEATRFAESTASLATTAESLAPDILRQSDTLRKAFKTGRAKAPDLERIANAVLEGTLNDETYTPDQLRKKGFSETQIALYHQTRKTVNKSVDDLARTTITRLARNAGIERDIAEGVFETNETAQDVAGELVAIIDPTLEQHRADLALNEKTLKDMRDQADQLKAVGGKDYQSARKNVDDLTAKINEIEQAIEHWEKTVDSIKEIADKSQSLQDNGYFPLMRFGKFTLDVVDENGKRIYYGMFETNAQVQSMKRLMRAANPKASIQSGIMNPDAWKQWKGMTPETLMLFGKEIGVDADAVQQEYLRKMVSNNSAMKRLIHRKKIPGFSEDLRRVLSSFLISNARQSAKNLHDGDMQEALKRIEKTKDGRHTGRGDVHQQAQKMVDYLQNPQEEFSGLRNFMFLHYIGGSIASAFTNITQIPLVTTPYLSQFDALAATTVAKWATGRSPTDAKHLAALKRAKEEGVVSPQEIYNLMATARGGTLGTGKLMQSRSVQNFITLWSTPFTLAEQYNRVTTFNAAFEIAIKKGEPDPYAFAKEAVEETQFVYAKHNRPNWARGIGAPLFTFKQFLVNYLEFLGRLPGKQKAVAFALLILATGLRGLPFEDDAEDLLDALMQWSGRSWNTQKEMEQFARDVLGPTLGDILLYGASEIPGVPISMQARLSLGNLIPGTGALVPSNTDKSRDAAEIFGAAGGLVKSAVSGAEALAKGDGGMAAYQVMPKAIQAALKGIEGFTDGAYTDSRHQLTANIDEIESFGKLFGFQPATVARQQRRNTIYYEESRFHQQKESGFVDRMARAIKDGDDDLLDEIMEELQEWNDNNPDQVIQIKNSQIKRRLRNMNTSAEERLMKRLPREIRGTF